MSSTNNVGENGWYLHVEKLNWTFISYLSYKLTPNQLLYSKENSQLSGKTAYRMREKFSHVPLDRELILLKNHKNET